MSGPLFTPAEWMAAEKKYRDITRQAAGCIVTGGVTAFQLVLLGVVVLVEYRLFYEIFDHLKGASAPGEPAPFSVGLLALTGTLMLAGYHIRAKEAENALPVRFVRRCVDVCLPLYAVGAGLAVAAVIYFDGADTFFRSAQAAPDLFADAPAPGVPGLDHFISMFPAMFSLACGGLAIINIFVGHRLVPLIWANVGTISTRVLKAKEAHAAMTVIRACQHKYAEAHREHAALLAVDHRAEEVALAQAAHAAMAEARKPYEKRLLDERLIVGPQPRFEPPQTNLNAREFEKQLVLLRAITVKKILSHMRGETDKE